MSEVTLNPTSVPTICLCSIVRNESRIITRMLDSVKSIIDYVSICDTGSTDDTVELIEKWLVDNNVKGKVHRHVWENFGHNRTKSFISAHASYGQATYLLCLDADMVLVIKPEFKKSDLTAGGYKMFQFNNTSRYVNMRLIRNTGTWISKGVTHEHLDPGGPASQDTVYTLEIDDREDGGCKSDKYERDLRLLLDDMKTDPNNVRTFFYLAQTYQCIGQNNKASAQHAKWLAQVAQKDNQTDEYAKQTTEVQVQTDLYNKHLREAVIWYKKRYNAGDWEEEKWYSLLRIAECYQSMDEMETCYGYYLRAAEERPHRAEGYFKLANLFRNRGQYNINAFKFAYEASKISYPKYDTLFIDIESHTYGPYLELSIVGWYCNKHETAVLASLKVLGMPEAPAYIKQMVLNNLIHYMPKFNLDLENLGSNMVNTAVNIRLAAQKVLDEQKSTQVVAVPTVESTTKSLDMNALDQVLEALAPVNDTNQVIAGAEDIVPIQEASLNV
jgi:glycosyltransferase involved in cell wall biosynthesis